MGKASIRAGEIEIVWLSFPPACPRRPEVGIHPSEWSFTHSHWPLQPPRLLYGRAANYGSFIVLYRGNDIQLSRFAFQLWATPHLGWMPLL